MYCKKADLESFVVCPRHQVESRVDSTSAFLTCYKWQIWPNGILLAVVSRTACYLSIQFVMFCCNMIGIKHYRFAIYVLYEDSNNVPRLYDLNCRYLCNKFRENNMFIKFPWLTQCVRLYQYIKCSDFCSQPSLSIVRIFFTLTAWTPNHWSLKKNPENVACFLSQQSLTHLLKQTD